MRFLPTNQIWRYWSFERFLVDVSALGLRDVDLWLCNQHVNIDAHAVYNATEVARLLRRYGVRAQTLTPEQSNPKAYNIASSDSVVQRLTKGYYEQVVSLGARLGVQRISLNAGWRLLDDEPARAWEALCSMLRTICRMAALASAKAPTPGSTRPSAVRMTAGSSVMTTSAPASARPRSIERRFPLW